MTSLAGLTVYNQLCCILKKSMYRNGRWLMNHSDFCLICRKSSSPKTKIDRINLHIKSILKMTDFMLNSIEIWISWLRIEIYKNMRCSQGKRNYLILDLYSVIFLYNSKWSYGDHVLLFIMKGKNILIKLIHVHIIDITLVHLHQHNQSSCR